MPRLKKRIDGRYQANVVMGYDADGKTLLKRVYGNTEAELTAANLGKPLPIRVDGRVVSAPLVNEPITGGEVQIAGVDQAEAERIAAALQTCPGEAAKTAG